VSAAPSPPERPEAGVPGKPPLRDLTARAKAIFEWHACRVLLDAGRRIGTHGEEREKFVEKTMSSIRLDGFSGRNT
jgi:hypothetical protein